MLEELGVVKNENTFLQRVDGLAQAAYEVIVSLRLQDGHPTSLNANTLSDYIPPDMVQGADFKIVTTVVVDYLDREKLDYEIGLSKFKDARTPHDPVTRNRALFKHHVQWWENNVYTKKKKRIDELVDRTLRDGFTDLTKNIARKLLVDDQENKGLSELVEGGIDDFQGKEKPLRAMLKKRLYEAMETEHFDNPELLYDLSCLAQMKNEGWQELNDEELVRKLKEEEMPLELAERYLRRKLSPEIVMVDNHLITGNEEVCDYVLLPKVRGYGAALQQLQQACLEDQNSRQPRTHEGIIRPLTIEEQVKVFVDNYAKGRELLNIFWDSCSAIVYKGNSSRFKILSLSPQLLSLDQETEIAELDIDYHKIEGPEFDRKDSAYRVPLSLEQYISHPVLNELLPDLALRREYGKIAGKMNKKGDVFSLFVEPNPLKDVLKPLYINHLDSELYIDDFKIRAEFQFMRLRRGNN